MNSVGSETASESLLFAWDSPRRAKFAIAAFLVLSLIAHALCFYIFQIVYPPTVALLPPPARITLITADSEDGRTLLRWIDAEDPALAFTTYRPAEAALPALPKAEHVPSYLATEPTLKELPAVKRSLSIPSCLPAGPVRTPRQRIVRAPVVVPTSVSFSSEFDVLGAPTLPQNNFVASNAETPRIVRFRTAVSALGEVRYCFAMDSSGDPALDEQGRLYLLRCRFAKAAPAVAETDSLVWGIATIEWSNDVARPQRQPGVTTPSDSR
jgi:hypothetical protein